jgi:hypothetical protein
MMGYDRYEVVTGSGGTTLTSLSGFWFCENAGTPAAASVNLRDGGAAGAIIARIKLAASESKGLSFTRPVRLTSGALYVQVTAGTIQGGVYGE